MFRVSDSFEITYGGFPSTRVKTNGRLLPPEFVARDESIGYRAPRFVAERSTGVDGGGAFVRIVVRPCEGGVSIECEVAGSDNERALLRHLRACLALAETEDDRVPAARACCRAHEWLQLAKREQHGRALAARGELGAARRQFMLARQHARGSAVRARLDQLRSSVEARAPEDAIIERRVATPDERLALDLRRLDTRVDPNVVLSVATDAHTLGRATIGLRVLARHWAALGREHRDAANELFERLIDQTGLELASRIVVAERSPELAEFTLAKWSTRIERAPHGLTLLGRTHALRLAAETPRSGGARPANLPALPYYEGAPGVAAPPR